MPDEHLRPPRSELLALLDAIKDHPDDDTPRLVLADWLDEQDNDLDSERAGFIRKDIATFNERKLRTRTREEAEEVEALCPRWLGAVAGLGAVTFERGLPNLLVSGLRILKPDVPALLASEAFAFVQFVRLTDAGGSRMEAMVARPEFRFVPGLGVSPFSALGTHYAEKFFASPNLTGLRRIEFRGVKPGAVGVQVLAANPALARLRKLSLVHDRLINKAVAALAGSTHLANLTHLNLADNNIGDGGAKALASAPYLANLHELNLVANPRLTDAGKQLLRDAFGDRVKC